MPNKDDNPRYKAVCCECGHIFYACKSIYQEMGINDAGCGHCPECKKLLNLTFDEETKEMKTADWEKYVIDSNKS